MPKLKTHKGAQSRFHVTGSGKVLRVKGPKSHLRVRKSKRVKRLFDKLIPVDKSNLKQVKKLIPYGA
ncbi:MAG: 50S ribosomal protein L35 [Chloroflexi bacterium]|nr:50S ribosomal protein L35 [Chloroflexota bacterium]